MSDRIYGHIPGVPVGELFVGRLQLSKSGVHRATQAGITGAAGEPAESIVVSGGYEDDQDDGHTIVYTGMGGRDPSSGRQTSDQQFDRGNAALVQSCVTGTPVRVIRGATKKSEGVFNAPEKGYRYDGLYRVESYTHERGVSNFLVCRFILVQIEEDAPVILEKPEPKGSVVKSPPPEYDADPPVRVSTVVQRVVRNSKLGEWVKKYYDFHCQRCGKRINAANGFYAECAHIRPLGKGHDGLDVAANVICLCPNCHTEFDLGGWAIHDDYKLCGVEGILTVRLDHVLDPANLKYRRDMFGYPNLEISDD